jgi:hypothetical protein
MLVVSLANRRQLSRWIAHGELPEPFLEAVLANDLEGALMRATPSEFEQLPALLEFLHRHVPAEARGSRSNVAEWLAAGGAQGRRQVFDEYAAAVRRRH